MGRRQRIRSPLRRPPGNGFAVGSQSCARWDEVFGATDSRTIRNSLTGRNPIGSATVQHNKISPSLIPTSDYKQPEQTRHPFSDHLRLYSGRSSPSLSRDATARSLTIEYHARLAAQHSNLQFEPNLGNRVELATANKICKSNPIPQSDTSVSLVRVGEAGQRERQGFDRLTKRSQLDRHPRSRSSQRNEANLWPPGTPLWPSGFLGFHSSSLVPAAEHYSTIRTQSRNRTPRRTRSAAPAKSHCTTGAGSRTCAAICSWQMSR